MHIMQTMHFMQIMQNVQTMQGIETMQTMQIMQGGRSRGFQDGPLYGMIDKNHTGRAVG